MTLAKAAAIVGVSPGTLGRWVRDGLIPQYLDEWTPAALGQARLVVRMRERGYTLEQIKAASIDGRLAFGPLTELFATGERTYTTRQAARAADLDAAIVIRLAGVLGVRPEDGFTEDDVQLFQYIAAVLDAGMPVDATLQLARVYLNAMSQVADAEVRLVHLFVHEPLMRSGGTPEEMAQELLLLAGGTLPLASPLFDRLHQRMLAQFIEQDVIGHMETEVGAGQEDIGRMRVAIAFADLTGYTRLTEEEGELAALDVVEKFTESVLVTLPDDARVIKTIGDEVMVIGGDPVALAAWAVGFQQLHTEAPLPRIAVHYGYALYRDGDYYGREVNLASRVAARSAGGEVLVTRPIVSAVGHELEFEHLADIRLKGFAEATELFIARPAKE
jgi:adenylate cyclase